MAACCNTTFWDESSNDSLCPIRSMLFALRCAWPEMTTNATAISPNIDNSARDQQQQHAATRK